MKADRRSVALALVSVLWTASVRTGSAEDVRSLLAPTGLLRVGVYLGSPTSLVRDRSGEAHGVTMELGGALAQRLGVPVSYAEYPRIAAVLDALKAGDVDFTVTNATPARAESAAFTPTLLALELGFLVPAGSPVSASSGLDGPGHRVGVTQGGTSARTLARELPKAEIMPVPTVARGIEMLRTGELAAYATNKAILFQMSDSLPGSRVLDGRWGVERLAIAIPKGREAALGELGEFIAEIRASRLLAGAVSRAGLRGLAPAE